MLNKPQFQSIRGHLMSLRVIILAVLALGVSVSILLAYLYTADKLRERHLAAASTATESLADLTALALREPLWQFDSAQAESMIDSVFVNPDVLLIEVIDHAGVLFASRRHSGLDGFERQGLVITSLRVIVRDEVKVGKLKLVVSTAGYLEELEETRKIFVRSAVLVVVVSLIVILLVLNWSFIRPIDRLVSVSARLATADLDEPIPALPSTELGRLASSLETTRIALIDLFAAVRERNRALEDANIHLEARVAERTRSLEKALDDLTRMQDEIVQSEKLASLGRIVAAVAHELNTPIGNALTVATFVADELDAIRDELTRPAPKRSLVNETLSRTKDGTDLLVKSIQRAAELITDFKQVAVDQTSDQRRVFDLAEVTGEVLNTLAPTVRRSACEFVTELESGVACDSFPGAYGQVLNNLVMNALIHGYTEQERQGPIAIAVKRISGDCACLAVRDEGRGMTDEVRHKIFDPFFTTRLGQGGSGLGMNIVYRIVTNVLGGSIAIESAEGRGTEIRVTLPLMAPEQAVAVSDSAGSGQASI